MLQFKTIAPAHATPIHVAPAADLLGRIIKAEMQALTAEGFFDFDIRWNGIALCIEARADDMHIRREFDRTGALSVEKVIDRGIGVERIFDLDGIGVLAEKVFSLDDDR